MIKHFERDLVCLVGWALLSCVFMSPLHAADTPKDAPVVEKPKILFLDLSATLIEEEVAKIITNMVSAQLGRYKTYDVITALDLRQLAELEVDKQKAGCSDNESCLSELAGAMGARYVVYGDVGKLGTKVIVALNLFDSEEARAVDREVLTANSLGDVPDNLPMAIENLIGNKDLGGGVVVEAEIPDAEGAAPTKEAKAAPPVSSETKAPAKNTTKSGGAFPWLRVGSAVALAAAGAGVALGYGLGPYQSYTEANAIRVDAGANASKETVENAQNAAAAYQNGPQWGLWGGSAVAIIAGSYALWTAVTAGGEE